MIETPVPEQSLSGQSLSLVQEAEPQDEESKGEVESPTVIGITTEQLVQEFETLVTETHVPETLLPEITAPVTSKLNFTMFMDEMANKEEQNLVTVDEIKEPTFIEIEEVEDVDVFKKIEQKSKLPAQDKKPQINFAQFMDAMNAESSHDDNEEIKQATQIDIEKVSENKVHVVADEFTFRNNKIEVEA